jgi:TPP-dependent indolepyruvate ferredoxin oxidoreductase alpha subunit
MKCSILLILGPYRAHPFTKSYFYVQVSHNRCININGIKYIKVALELQYTGLEEATFRMVARRYVKLSRQISIDPLPTSILSRVCNNLGVIRILLVENSDADLEQRIQLYVRPSDVRYALHDENQLKDIVQYIQ